MSVPGPRAARAQATCVRTGFCPNSACRRLHNTAGSTEHVEFNGAQFSINGSFLIVDQDNRVLFDTSAVDLDLPCIRQYDPIQGGGGASPLKWQAVPEELPQKAGIAAEGWLLSTAPLEQLNTTDDKTDYLLYLVSLPPAPSFILTPTLLPPPHTPPPS